MDVFLQEEFDPEELEQLEEDVVNLQAQLEGKQGAGLASESADKLVGYIEKEQEQDLLIVGPEENRWNELIVEQEAEEEKTDQKSCCSVQ